MQHIFVAFQPTYSENKILLNVDPCDIAHVPDKLFFENYNFQGKFITELHWTTRPIGKNMNLPNAGPDPIRKGTPACYGFLVIDKTGRTRLFSGIIADKHTCLHVYSDVNRVCVCVWTYISTPTIDQQPNRFKYCSYFVLNYFVVSMGCGKSL